MEAPGVEPDQAHAGNLNDDAPLARMRLESLGIFSPARPVPYRLAERVGAGSQHTGGT